MKECELQGTRSLHFPSVSSRSTEEKVGVVKRERTQTTNLWNILCWRSWDGGQVVRVVGEVNNSDAVSVSLNLIIGKVKIENDLHFLFSFYLSVLLLFHWFFQLRKRFGLHAIKSESLGRREKRAKK